MLTRRSREDGSISLLVVGYTAIALVMIVVAVDVSKVFLARRALASAADASALSAAQGIDRGRVYARGLQCGSRLPLDPQRAAALAAASLEDDQPALRRALAAIDEPVTAVAAGTVTVQLSGAVSVPFGRVLAWLDPSRGDGRVHISETAHAQSPVTGTAGC